MSSNEGIGPHLLGRVPRPADSRDFQLETFLSGSPLDQALATLLADQHVAKATKVWANTVTQYLKAMPAPQNPPAPAPSPTPAPSPSGQDVSWTDVEQLDQGQTNHCVGFGWAQWGNTLPINDDFADSDGNAIYYECKVIDGQPKQENGSNVRSGAKAMQARGRLTAYAFASTIDGIRAWLRSKGPVVVGTDWTQDMFNPNGDGYVTPTGSVAGGHCYLLAGDVESEGALLFQNSWGTSWGTNGYFKMKVDDWAKLFANQGDACTSVELPM
jgi:Papain family cysteine protease